MHVGQEVSAGHGAELDTGNTAYIGSIPEGTKIYNVSKNNIVKKDYFNKFFINKNELFIEWDNKFINSYFICYYISLSNKKKDNY